MGNGNVGASGEPRGLVPPITDYMTGTAIGMAICAALLHRERSGEGQLIEGFLLQSALAIQDVYVMRQPVTDASMRDPLMEDVNLLRQRGASYVEQLARRSQYRDTGASPSRLYYRGYVARDGAIVLGCLTRATRDGARQVLGMSHNLSDHPDYDSTDPATAEETDRCAREIEQQIRQRPVEHWLRIFAEAGVPVAPVRFLEEVADDPHIEAMGIMVDLEHELTGPQRVVGPLVSMSQTPLSARRASPALGGQTSEILRETGITPTDIQELFARRVVGGSSAERRSGRAADPVRPDRPNGPEYSVDQRVEHRREGRLGLLLHLGVGRVLNRMRDEDPLQFGQAEHLRLRLGRVDKLRGGQEH